MVLPQAFMDVVMAMYAVEDQSTDNRNQHILVARAATLVRLHGSKHLTIFKDMLSLVITLGRQPS